MSKKITNILYFLATLLVIADGIYLRILMFLARKVETGGDTYNILVMARNFIEFTYPINEKRLPLYSLLLTPVANNPLIAVEYAKGLSLIFSVLTTVIILKLIWKLFKSPAIVLVSSILLSLNSVLVLESVRALSDSLFILLTSASVYFFFHLNESKKPKTKDIILFGTILFAASMTRFEGFIVAAVLFFSAFLKFKQKNRAFLAIAAFYLVAVAIFLLKVPFFKLYFKDGNYGSNSPNDLQEKARLAVENIKFLFFNWNIEHLMTLKRVIIESGVRINRTILYVYSEWKNIAPNIAGLGYLLMLGYGPIKLFRKNKLFGFALVSTLASLYFIANWWMPRGRFYASQMPLFLIILSAGMHAFENGYLKKTKNLFLRLMVLVIVFLVMVSLYGTMRKGIVARIGSESVDTSENYQYINMLKFLHSQNDATVIINPQGVESSYYLDKAIVVDDAKEIDELKLNCDKKPCYYFELKVLDIKSQGSDKYQLKTIKKATLKNLKRELTIYRLVKLEK